MEINELQAIAKGLRRDIVEMIYRAKSGHPGGSLSIADIFNSIILERNECRSKKILKWKIEIDLF